MTILRSLTRSSDCEYQNLMMDANALFPSGFHPVRTTFDPAYEQVLTPESRTTNSVKYYFIDFGISSYFDGACEPRLVTGIDGRDQGVPELDLEKLYDPFLVDIFTLGNTYKRLIRVSCAYHFLLPDSDQ